MAEEDTVFVDDFCAGCGRKHRVGITRRALKEGLQPGKEVELYCINSDSRWNMSDAEKQKTRKALAEGRL